MAEPHKPQNHLDRFGGLRVVEADSLRKGCAFMKTKLYLAYGSNLNVCQMLARCPNAALFGTAEIKNYELLFKGSKTGAYLTIERRKGSCVPVGVWAVTEHDILALDRYEGFPAFYYKKVFKRQMWGKGGENLGVRECFAYIMHEDRKIGIPSPMYVNTCREGYNDFGFDTDILMDAIKRSKDVTL